MKFLFIAPRFHTNQVFWIDSLIESNHEVFFHSQLRGEIENYKQIRPLIFPPCNLSYYLTKLFGEGGVNNPRGFPNPFSYYKELKELQPEVIIIRDVTRWFSLLGAMLARYLRIEIIIYSQTDLFKHYSFKRTFLTKFILTIFDAKWITPIKGDRANFNFHPKGMYFVPFAVDIKKIKKERVQRPYELLSVGKFENRKNQLMLLKVIKKAIDNGFKLNLVLIGEISKDAHQQNFDICNKFIKDNDLSEVVEILINISHEKMASFYQSSDLFILPATAEPASISVLESVGFGIPAICSDTNGTRFYLTENQFGITFKDNDEESLYSALKTILNGEKLDFYRDKIFSNVESVISKQVFYETFIKLLRNEKS